MSIVVLEDVSLHLGGKVIVDELGLRLDEKDRIGLIGPNGSGKSTLLRLISGEQQPDGGLIRTRKDARIGYLPQDVHVDGGQTLMGMIRSSVPGRKSIEEKLERAEKELSELSENPDAEDYVERITEAGGRVGELHEELAAFESMYSDFEAMRIMSGLGFKASDHDRDMSEFSGGWKMRAVLASLLFQRPDLLLLDEPTNHLDMPSVAWLSAFLQRYDRSFILITHDREFLDEQANKIVSFEPEGVRQYPGDYKSYRKQRAEELVLLENRQKNIQREREQIERFVKRFRAKATKAVQVQSRIKKLEKMEVIDLPSDRATINFRFPTVEQPGKVVLEVEDLDKSYGDHKVLEGVKAHVPRGERIALLGVNGAGKTTLLRILAGEIEASGGSYEFGHRTKVGYYAQHHAATLPKENTVYDAVRGVAQDASNQQIRAALGAMLFGEQEIEKYISVLSGGERARVALAQLLVNPGNVLLMDEPTNHLDLESSERLADALDGFEGTLLFVSHNRSFIRKLAKTIWFVEDGKVVVYPGTLDDYMDKCRLEGLDPASAAAGGGASSGHIAPGSSAGAKANKSKKAAKEDAPAPEEKPRQRQRKENREQRKARRALEKRSQQLEKRIAKLEKEQGEREAKMADLSAHPEVDPAAIAKEYERTSVELEVAMDTWTEVQSELEEL